MKVINSLFCRTCLSALVISCCEYFLITVKPISFRCKHSEVYKRLPGCKKRAQKDVSTFTKTYLLLSRLYCRFWNFTKSCACTLADCTADRESHPALKTLLSFCCRKKNNTFYVYSQEYPPFYCAYHVHFLQIFPY